MELRSFIYRCFRPNATPVTSDDTLHNGEPYTCSFKLFLAMEALKDRKEFVAIIHVEAHSIVCDGVHDIIIGFI